jgi:AraC family transcriptional regulator
LTVQLGYVRKVEPLSADWRSFAWMTGAFDTAHRSYDQVVEGTICMPRHLVLVTLKGEAEWLEVASACGHRYTGRDRPGAVSFVPAHCERRLRLLSVRSEWASISLSPTLLEDEAFDNASDTHALDGATFTNGDDPFLAGMVAEFARLYATDGTLDTTYCETMSLALARYLARRYGHRRGGIGVSSQSWRLPAWRLRRIVEYVEARVEGRDEGGVRIDDLAGLVPRCKN